MRVLALSFFDPASVVLSHRNLMRAAGHDFRLAVVRAYTERQRQADYAVEQLVEREAQAAPGIAKRELFFERLAPNLDELREFAASADVIQFHPGIGHGDGDWASRGDLPPSIADEIGDVLRAFGLSRDDLGERQRAEFCFMHGSVAAWRNISRYQNEFTAWAASTLDYAVAFDAAYLPPLIQVPEVDGAPVLARLRGDDDPLIIAHTPTDRVACSTEDFLKAAREVGVVVLLGEGKPHKEIMALKAQAFAGFDHLRGSFSVNTLENAALGLVPLVALRPECAKRMLTEDINPGPLAPLGAWVEDLRASAVQGSTSLRALLTKLDRSPPMTRGLQRAARSWWQEHFSAEPITKRLLKFYESL